MWTQCQDRCECLRHTVMVIPSLVSGSAVVTWSQSQSQIQGSVFLEVESWDYYNYHSLKLIVLLVLQLGHKGK